MFVEKSILIDAPVARVWDTLTKSEFTKQYMFNCEAISDWKEGSTLEWKGAADGKIYVTGVIKKIVPGAILQYTASDPNRPEAHQTTVTDELKETEEGVLLTVTQGDYAKVKDGEKYYKECVGGWEMVMPKMKEVAEKQG